MKPHTTKQPIAVVAPDASPLASIMSGPFADAMQKSAAMFGKGMRSMQLEGLKFMNRRVEDNLKAAQAFGACRSMPDLFAAQQQWLSDVAQAYNEEWIRCSELMTDISREDAEPTNDAANERPARPR